MVKGISKQVIVVRQPDTKLFDQAIFLLRDDAIGDGITDQQLLQEAKRAANTYLDSTTRKPALARLRGLLYLGLGAGITGIVWFLTAILG